VQLTVLEPSRTVVETSVHECTVAVCVCAEYFNKTNRLDVSLKDVSNQ